MVDIIKSCTGWNIKDRLEGKAKDALKSAISGKNAFDEVLELKNELSKDVMKVQGIVT